MGLITRYMNMSFENRIRRSKDKRYKKPFSEGGSTKKERIEWRRQIFEEAAGKPFEEILKGSYAEYRGYYKDFDRVMDFQDLRKEGLGYKVYARSKKIKYLDEFGNLDQEKLNERRKEIEPRFIDSQNETLAHSYYHMKGLEKKDKLPGNKKLRSREELIKYFDNMDSVEEIKEDKIIVLKAMIYSVEHETPKDVFNSNESPYFQDKYRIKNKEIKEYVLQKAKEIEKEYERDTGIVFDPTKGDAYYKIAMWSNRELWGEHSELIQLIEIGNYLYIQESLDKIKNEKIREGLDKIKNEKIREGLEDYTFISVVTVAHPIADGCITNSTIIKPQKRRETVEKLRQEMKNKDMENKYE